MEREELKRIGWWGWKCDGDAAAVQVALAQLTIMWPPYRYITDFLQCIQQIKLYTIMDTMDWIRHTRNVLTKLNPLKVWPK
ncbi:hypothetical protein PENSUB_12080 [Penicillium subrubescens]|uniref:Uncharacterized protein n=1 Tax=Penicillium subrubescens TaxID=1316194 RepID=A0A1Q5T0J8_9EURO|nr:hypothetical protein PENSUB_12080 [Penicillium subrubescens]